MSYRFADVYHCCMYSEKKTPDDGQRNFSKQVEFYSKNKFEKLVLLGDCIMRISCASSLFFFTLCYDLLFPQSVEFWHRRTFPLLKRYFYVLAGLLLCAAAGTAILSICGYFKFYFRRPCKVNMSIGL